MEGSGRVTGSNFFPAALQLLKSGSWRYHDSDTTVWAVTTSLKNIFATFHCLSWLFQLAVFSASQLAYLLSPLHSNSKAIKEIKWDVLLLPMEWKRWQNKRKKLWLMNLSMEAKRWLNSALSTNLLKQYEWKSVWRRLTMENKNLSSI